MRYNYLNELHTIVKEYIKKNMDKLEYYEAFVAHPTLENRGQLEYEVVGAIHKEDILKETSESIAKEQVLENRQFLWELIDYGVISREDFFDLLVAGDWTRLDAEIKRYFLPNAVEKVLDGISKNGGEIKFDYIQEIRATVQHYIEQNQKNIKWYKEFIENPTYENEEKLKGEIFNNLELDVAYTPYHESRETTKEHVIENRELLKELDEYCVIEALLEEEWRLLDTTIRQEILWNIVGEQVGKIKEKCIVKGERN